MKLVHGMGINDRRYPTELEGKQTKAYLLWSSMLRRCYSRSYQDKQPTYIGCSVSDTFKHFSLFYDWCQNQIGFDVEGFDLDKDIIVPGNKIYSENTCAFVPYEINSFFNDTGTTRGEYPIGVYYNKHARKFRAYCAVNGKAKHLGYFLTSEEAHAVYKQFKEELCKQTALAWKSSIDHRVYKSMMCWEVQ